MPAFDEKFAMDKDIWQQIKEDSKSFEEVLLLSSKLVSIDRKYIREVKAIDSAYETRKTFTLNDWKKLHDIGIGLWYKQYFNLSNSFNFKYFSNEFRAKFRETVSLLIQKSIQLSQLQDGDSLRRESLEAWKDFIARLSFLTYLSHKQLLRNGKKTQKLVTSNPDSQFAIFAVISLIIGVSVAIVVSLISR